MGFITRRWVHRGFHGLLDELDHVITLSRDREAENLVSQAVSGWTVQQHLEHLWRSDQVIFGFLQRVGDGTATTDGAGSTVPGQAVMWLGRIPRGRGRAPEVTRPEGTATSEITNGFEALRRDVEGMGGLLDRLARSTTTRRHPLLGCYTAAQWLRFAHIHHVHHRRIIEDIRAVGSPQ